MKNPGPVKVGTDLHDAMVKYANELALAFEVSPMAILGQLVKLHECIGKAAESPIKMSSLVISNKSDEYDDGLL